MDLYDHHIEECLEKECFEGWMGARGLFQFASATGKSLDRKCGCLTMIRENVQFNVLNADGSVNEELTEAIRADTRLPETVWRETPTREQLEAMAEWQRRLDREIRGM